MQQIARLRYVYCSKNLLELSFSLGILAFKHDNDSNRGAARKLDMCEFKGAHARFPCPDRKSIMSTRESVDIVELGCMIASRCTRN